MPPKLKNYLGKSLVKDRFGNRKRNGKDSFLHTTELDDGVDWNKLNFKSVTEENTLQEFLCTAELANTQFNAERRNATILTPENVCPSKDELEKNKKIQIEHKSSLRIPRRPTWDVLTTAEKLDEMERQVFLDWRHSLAMLSEKEGLIMTPFEKNLEFWRQLWRVIERSDIVVQILDARNPLLFRCEDLETYVKEVGADKMNVLLINKADFLSEEQRQCWLDYFNSQNISVYFWSALKELNDLKKKKNDDSETENDDDDEEESEDDDEEDEDEDDEENEVTPTSVLNKKQLLKCFRDLGMQLKGEDELVTVGLIGYPNVGKSSTLNALLTERFLPEGSSKLKHQQASVSSTPGKTKHFQTFFIDEWLLLCDCPGLVMPNFVSSKAEMITNGILSIDQLHDHIPSVSLVCRNIPRRLLEFTYGIILPMSEENSADSLTHQQLLTAYARVRGFMTARGTPDCSRAARIILKDFVSGKLCYCHCPPTSTEDSYKSRPFVPENVEISVVDKIAKATEAQKVRKEQIIEKIKKKTGKPTKEGSLKKPRHKKKEKLRRVYDRNCEAQRIMMENDLF